MYRRVDECNEYRKRNTPSKYDMEKHAWLLKTDAKRTTVGFVRPGTAEHRKLSEHD
jgi:hypothetical protein